MNIKIGLWPLSGNYGKTFSQDYLAEYVDQASILGFHIFDNAESYGSETFQREISEVLSLKRSVKVDTKIRVDFSQKQWLKLLEHDFEKIYKKYGEQLNAIFLHNPRGTLKQTLIALETILKFCEVTQSRSGISLQKTDMMIFVNFRLIYYKRT